MCDSSPDEITATESLYRQLGEAIAEWKAGKETVFDVDAAAYALQRFLAMISKDKKP